jgi:hypothetical protein
MMFAVAIVNDFLVAYIFLWNQAFKFLTETLLESLRKFDAFQFETLL